VKPCLECGTRHTCPRCRAELAAAAPTPSPVQPAAIPPAPAEDNHEGEGNAAGVALERAVELTRLLAQVDGQAARLRAERRGLLRQATAGLPVTRVAEVLGVSRQWVHRMIA
jgi:hypothetical protein